MNWKTWLARTQTVNRSNKQKYEQKIKRLQEFCHTQRDNMDGCVQYWRDYESSHLTCIWNGQMYNCLPSKHNKETPALLLLLLLPSWTTTTLLCMSCLVHQSWPTTPASSAVAAAAAAASHLRSHRGLCAWSSNWQYADYLSEIRVMFEIREMRSLLVAAHWPGQQTDYSNDESRILDFQWPSVH